MRILVDVEQLPWEEAWAITTGTFAYTNHTVLPEALERWPVRLLEELLPRHMQIILEINHRFLEEVRATQMDDAMVQAMSIIEEGDEQRVRMANLAIIGSHAVNGVAELHTRILKESLFAAFHRHQPGKFTNKTNGISQRRWLRKCNPGLAELITEAIGDGWVKDPMLLRGLEPLADDDVFIAHWIAVRRANKRRLAELVHRDTGVIIEPDSLFDAHIKRFHEYKRQLLTILHVLTLYTRILDAPMKAMVPRTVIFSGKAAPGYLAAKLHIKLINAIADHVNTDPVTRGRLRVVFLKNYSVSLAERIIPAADLSEQVSTAGYEASGTGNMKFMMNGALTIGTLDGATIEIRDAVGEENIFTFGLTDEAVRVLRREGHSPQELYWSTPQLQRVMNLLRDNVFNPGEPGIFQPVFDSLYHTDWYCLLADYASYIATQDRVSEAYRDARTWARMSIINTARSGRFSSDRTIREYADEIWHVQPVPVDPTFGSAPGALDGAE